MLKAQPYPCFMRSRTTALPYLPRLTVLGEVFRPMITEPGRSWPAVEGIETDTYWRRVDDGSREGYAELEQGVETPIAPGSASAMVTGEIHSVANKTAETTISLHVYGRHVGFIDRSQFDPESNVQEPFKVVFEE